MARAKGVPAKPKRLERDLPPIFNFKKIGDKLEGVFQGISGTDAYRTLVFETAKGKQAVWWKVAFEGVAQKMQTGQLYRLCLEENIKTSSGRSVKDVAVYPLF